MSHGVLSLYTAITRDHYQSWKSLGNIRSLSFGRVFMSDWTTIAHVRALETTQVDVGKQIGTKGVTLL